MAIEYFETQRHGTGLSDPVQAHQCRGLGSAVLRRTPSPRLFLPLALVLRRGFHRRSLCSFDLLDLAFHEAGRDGFWLHRWLRDQDIDNRVLDPASLEVPRRWRRVKTDRVDTLGLLRV